MNIDKHNIMLEKGFQSLKAIFNQNIDDLKNHNNYLTILTKKVAVRATDRVTEKIIYDASTKSEQA